tara:strand:+ start:10065 stop:11102 length:1038 start_codon:yes stop_codon:yes gene_type:complete
MQVEELDINDAWDKFLDGNDFDIDLNHFNFDSSKTNNQELAANTPKVSDIYISTKTTIAYLSEFIDLNDIFWKINISPYHIPCEGVVKKQMKFNFTSKDELSVLLSKLENLENVEQNIITQINNPDGRIKFKDIRKISIGISSKDIVSHKVKKKSAFYNCFVLIIRLLNDDVFKEVHVKIFNTGKLEIPGIRCTKLFNKLLDLILDILKPLVNDGIHFKENAMETVLINSNFTCGFYINREILIDILKYKYQINVIFDSCQYPGIQCKYIYTDENNIAYKMSFMIFRTGSVLIVGKCNEDVLMNVYEFIKNILISEYDSISVRQFISEKPLVKNKKIKKKLIEVT